MRAQVPAASGGNSQQQLVKLKAQVKFGEDALRQEQELVKQLQEQLAQQKQVTGPALQEQNRKQNLLRFSLCLSCLSCVFDHCGKSTASLFSVSNAFEDDSAIVH